MRIVVRTVTEPSDPDPWCIDEPVEEEPLYVQANVEELDALDCE